MDGKVERREPAKPAKAGTAKQHIVLTSHPRDGAGKLPEINWDAESSQARGPIIAGSKEKGRRNVIGAHSGAYALYRAMAIASGQLDPIHTPDLTNTAPAVPIGPYPQWSEPGRIVSLDPYGHMVGEMFSHERSEGLDIRPTIAVTKAHINMPEVREGMQQGRVTADGDILLPNGDVRVTKVAVEPVWHLPGVAKRFDIAESELRRSLFEHSGGMYTELITRPDLKVFLPPIGGITVYIVGDATALNSPKTNIACRVHDECNGSDVFGSDICTCRPYLVHGLELCIETAQKGGVGVMVYNRKEGRALGEVTKFLVYNARKRQPGGDRAETYFERTECVAGVVDARFQELMPDIFHWLGIRRIDRFASMSDMKHDAMTRQGIEIVERVPIPDALIPDDAHVELDAKKAAGYFTGEAKPATADLTEAKGRPLDG